jgi:hypothetical protein
MQYFPSKSVVMLRAAGVTNAGTASANLDTLGYDRLILQVASTTSNNTTNNPSVFKLSHSDTTDASNFSDITELVGDGAGGWTVPSWHTQTADEKAVMFNVDLRHRKRYLKLTISPVTTQDFLALALLTQAEVAPVSASDAGVLALVAA